MEANPFTFPPRRAREEREASPTTVPRPRFHGRTQRSFDRSRTCQTSQYCEWPSSSTILGSAHTTSKSIIPLYQGNKRLTYLVGLVNLILSGNVSVVVGKTEESVVVHQVIVDILELIWILRAEETRTDLIDNLHKQ